jgi:hypothetical protein
MQPLFQWIKKISITYFECVSMALVIQQGMCMLHVILSSVVCLTLQYFSKLPHKRHYFRKSVTEHNYVF